MAQEFEIELKYSDGTGHSRDRTGVEAKRRVYAAVDAMPRRGLGITIVSTQRASWPTMPRATPMLAAKSSARSSNRMNEEILACHVSEKSRLSSPPA
jgi:hypothetical protein